MELQNGQRCSRRRTPILDDRKSPLKRTGSVWPGRCSVRVFKVTALIISVIEDTAGAGKLHQICVGLLTRSASPGSLRLKSFNSTTQPNGQRDDSTSRQFLKPIEDEEFLSPSMGRGMVNFQVLTVTACASEPDQLGKFVWQNLHRLHSGPAD